ncbi:MAG: nucleotide exchange factor GrpE [Rubrobacteraceae bacterium]|nr:nucleotide exchange factor GrpE [Rubrobacteraceae bacterium]
MSSEENKRDPEPRDDLGPQEGPEGEAQRSPENPAPLESEAGDPSVPEGIEDEPAVEADPEADGLLALSEELDATRWERDQYLDALRRLKAEFENSRKRQERERTRIFSMASERLVQELLPVLDNLDRALEAGGDIREGVHATRDQLADVLANEGLLPVASDGQPFDPNVHDAVMGQPSEEHEEGTVIQTFQRGYLLNGKPIRPAKVVVAKQV